MTRSATRRRGLRAVAWTALAVLAGALAGLVLAFVTPTHVEVAGSDTRIWIRPGCDFDKLGVNGVVSLERATPRAIGGESIGIEAILDLDPAELVNAKGEFDANVLPAYIQAYSDPQQLVEDLRFAVIVHLVVFVSVGAGVGLLAAAGVLGYRRWRVRYDAAHWPDPADRRRARAYRGPERRFVRRAAVGVVVLAVVALVPSSHFRRPAPRSLAGDALFNGTPLEGARVEGLLRPALLAAQSYVRTYFGDTDAYYDRLAGKLDDLLENEPVQLTDGDDVAHLGFVTDRHCNIGMDRVTVDLLRRLHVATLVSAGDDAFSGSFGFEAACTRGLAERSKRAGITDVFAAGNHDSAQTVEFERQQGIRTLTGDVVDAGGLRFIGSPDPRTSRYGQGIRPASNAAQRRVTDKQGARVGRTACAASGPVIAVLHDPGAGSEAIDHGCGRVTLALDGHTHEQGGPYPHALPDGAIAAAFTGASGGGAPGGAVTAESFASRLTVGPLNHPASVYLLDVSRSTGTLLAVTVVTFRPDQDITVSQVPVS